MHNHSHPVGRRVFAVACFASLSLLSSNGAAQSPPPPQTLAVGDAAPDFTIRAANASGVAAKPFRLSEHRGETVVLAFFPRARSGGCTVQLESYRDQYATLFKGGQRVTLLPISVDPDTALTSWARDAKFPFAFGSDEDRSVGRMYGASTSPTTGHRRVLYVIGPDGKIAYVAAPFKQMAAEAYTELGAAVAKSSGSR